MNAMHLSILLCTAAPVAGPDTPIDDVLLCPDLREYLQPQVRAETQQVLALSAPVQFSNRGMAIAVGGCRDMACL